MIASSIRGAALLHVENEGSIYCHVSDGSVQLPPDISLADLFRCIEMAKEEK